MVQDRGDCLPLAAWDAESLRFTAFCPPFSPVDDSGWWDSLMGGPPEVEVARRRERGKSVEGAFEPGRLVIQTSPHRVDFHVIPSPEHEAIDGFLTIGKFEQALGSFDELMSRWLTLDSCPDMQRIGFGAVLLSPVDSKVSGYRQLAAYLPSVTIDAERSTDLLYQINRPRDRTAGIPAVKINRLSKWSVAQMIGAGFVVGPTQILHRSMSPAFQACRLELDINTEAERQEPLPREAPPIIFRELMDLGIQIVRAGDIP